MDFLIQYSFNPKDRVLDHQQPKHQLLKHQMAKSSTGNTIDCQKHRLTKISTSFNIIHQEQSKLKFDFIPRYLVLFGFNHYRAPINIFQLKFNQEIRKADKRAESIFF